MFRNGNQEDHGRTKVNVGGAEGRLSESRGHGKAGHNGEAAGRGAPPRPWRRRGDGRAGTRPAGTGCGGPRPPRRPGNQAEVSGAPRTGLG